MIDENLVWDPNQWAQDLETKSRLQRNQMTLTIQSLDELREVIRKIHTAKFSLDLNISPTLHYASWARNADYVNKLDQFKKDIQNLFDVMGDLVLHMKIPLDYLPDYFGSETDEETGETDETS